MPNTIPEIARDDSSSDAGVHSINSENSVPSFADQQKEAEAAKDGAIEMADHTEDEVKEFSKKAESELSRLEAQSGKKYQEFSKEAKDSYEKWKGEAQAEYKKARKEAGKQGEKAKKEVKKAGEWTKENQDNPVVIGNAVVIAALAAGLGFGAYRLNQQGQNPWKIAGMGAGVLAAFATADYFVSQYVASRPC